ncbi:Methyltransferase TM1293 [hydrothermal vent metagenome]|uniref:Methyltransferase TM1293 n=1 Tax=hydrothermal vent metagenome TaxID=652676 RepID=A0A3B1C2Q0_9ZZZZ
MAKTKPFDNYFDEYENWFDANKFIFQSELNAIKKAIPKDKKGVEIGIGSGIFAVPLGISEGVEPSLAMRTKAIEKELNVIDTVAEELPYQNNSQDFVLMVTTICFVDDIYKSFEEINRILKTDGEFIIGYVDKDSLIGKFYLEHQHESLFYKDATFFGTEKLIEILETTGFIVKNIYQTVFGFLNEIDEVQETLPGFGKGSFVVIKAKKGN